MDASVSPFVREGDIVTGMPVISNTSWTGTVSDIVAETAGAPAGVRIAWQGDGETVVPLSACRVSEGMLVVQFATTPTTDAANMQQGERTSGLASDESLTLPLITETLHTDVVWRDAGTVRIHLRAEEFPQTATEETSYEELDVQQVAVGRVLAEDERVEPRQEGEVYILPVIREELVVTKRRILDHELRLTKRQVTTTQTVETTLRRTRATVEAGALAKRIHVDEAISQDAERNRASTAETTTRTTGRNRTRDKSAQ